MLQASPLGVTCYLNICRFQCLNQRYPIQFVYFKNITSGPYPFSGYTSPKVVAFTAPIAVNPNEPTQGHLSFTNITGCALLDCLAVL